MWSCPCSLPDAGGQGEEKPLEGLLARVIKSLGPRRRISEEEIAEAWRDAVGEAASIHTRPVSFQGGRLTVNVDGSSWLYELTLKKKEIVKSLEGRLKGKKLKEIRFRIGEVARGEKPGFRAYACSIELRA